MTTAIVVPTKEFHSFYGEKAIPTQAKAYGYNFPTHILSKLSYGPFDSAAIVAIYEKQPQNILDKLFKRTRYRLVSARTPGWGTIIKDKASKQRADAVVFNLDTSHLNIKHNWYVDVPKLYKDMK